MSNQAPESGLKRRAVEMAKTTVVKSQRVFACLLCSQRKIKCDRMFPCANCVRASAQCVPITRRPRRRRFPERELLDRLRHYENLLRQNKVNFEPLHPRDHDHDHDHSSPSEDTNDLDSLAYAPSDMPREAPDIRSNKAVDFFHAISRLTLDPGHHDDQSDNNHHVSDAEIKSLWVRGNDHLLFFGTPRTNVQLSTFHPEQAQIFRLWQIYLENVNPFLKVTHASTLQARIIGAISNITSISPTLEALIFSIYCVSVASLTEDECYTWFGAPRKDLLSSYYFACRQALRVCGILHSGEPDCLTAFYLYLVSVRAQVDPRSLSSILAIAIRIAKRMDMHDESSYTKYNALEAEMRRRLWWSLTLFDHRICEMSNYKDTSLAPTWDCKPPRNVNDPDLWLGMKAPPTIHEKPTEALFVIVRSELANYLRYSAFHINFINPSLNNIDQPKAAGTRPRPILENDDFMALEKTIEDKYLAFCDPENPVHFMTIWTTRSTLARNRLLHYYSRLSISSMQPTDVQRHAAISCALSMLECDTKLRTNPLTKGFLWLVDMYLPAIAFNHILHGLRNRPNEDYAEKAWDAMSDNYEARALLPSTDKQSNLVSWIRIVLHVWEIREAFLKRQNLLLEPPRIVTSMRNKLKQMSSNGEQPNDALGIHSGESRLDMQMDMECFTGLGLGGYPDTPRHGNMDVDADQFWTTIDWTQIHTER